MGMYRKKALFAILMILLLSAVALSVYGDGETWDCPACGRTGNTGKFCGSCGQPAPTPPPETTPASESASTPTPAPVIVLTPTPEPPPTPTPKPAKKAKLPGDVTGDGTVDIVDLIRLQKYLYGGKKVEVDTNASDMNGDGTINLIDYIQLQKALLAGR